MEHEGIIQNFMRAFPNILTEKDYETNIKIFQNENDLRFKLYLEQMEKITLDKARDKIGKDECLKLIESKSNINTFFKLNKRVIELENSFETLSHMMYGYKREFKRPNPLVILFK